MAFSAFIRRVSAAAARASQGFYRQNHRSTHFAPHRPFFKGGMPSHGRESKIPASFLPLTRFYSSLQNELSADSELLRIIQSEIKCAKEETREAAHIPKDFPFKIQDEEGANVVTLRRDYLNENIEVVVSMPSVEEPGNNEGADDGENNQGGDEKSNQPTIPLIVNISKNKSLNLEFCCSAYADEVVIDSLSVKERKESENDLLAYVGPDFSDLDENLQKAFHKFLEKRGISPATTNFLYEYMINKDDEEYVRWLQNLKQFVEK